MITTLANQSRTIAILVAALAAMPALGQDAGKAEYMNNCSACHGDSAMGDGPIAKYMNVSVPSLTGLAKANDGTFPYLKVLQIIDGRQGLGPHGTPMPVWGDRFEVAAAQKAGDMGAELLVRGKLQALTDYLQSIQE